MSATTGQPLGAPVTDTSTYIPTTRLPVGGLSPVPEGPESIASSNYSAYASQETGFQEESEDAERQQVRVLRPGTPESWSWTLSHGATSFPRTA